MKVRFSLPVEDCSARFAVKSNGALNVKDYVPKVAFPGVDLSRNEAIECHLFYSDSLESAFFYTDEQSEGELGYTPYFRVPEGATTLEVEVERWQKSIEVAAVQTIRLHMVAPWREFNRLTINGVEVDG